MFSYTSSSAASTSNLIWNAWSDSTTGSITADSSVTYTTNSGNVWTGWVTGGDSGTSGTSFTWSTWIESSGNESILKIEPYVVWKAEDVVRIEVETRAERERWAEESRRRQVIYDLAKSKARDLWEGCLSEEQLRTWGEKGFIMVVSESGKIYRIKEGQFHNVDLLDEQHEPVESYCIQPANVPIFDTMLAQKLMLEGGDEKRFLDIANKQHIHRVRA